MLKQALRCEILALLLFTTALWAAMTSLAYASVEESGGTQAALQLSSPGLGLYQPEPRQKDPDLFLPALSLSSPVQPVQGRDARTSWLEASGMTAPSDAAIGFPKELVPKTFAPSTPTALGLSLVPQGLRASSPRFSTYFCANQGASASVATSFSTKIPVAGRDLGLSLLAASDARLVSPDSSSLARSGETMGVATRFALLPGLMTTEAAAMFSGAAAQGSDGKGSHDSAYRLKTYGSRDFFRYSVLYEQTGAKYGLAGEGLQRDLQAWNVKLGAGGSSHRLDIALSQRNNNLDLLDSYPRRSVAETGLDYSFSQPNLLTAGLQYRRKYVADREVASGTLVNDYCADTLSSKLTFLAQKWDVGVRWSLGQRYDRLGERPASLERSIGLSPKYRGASVVVAPDLALSRSRDYLDGADVSRCDLGLLVRDGGGEIPFKFRVEGKYSREEQGASQAAKEAIALKLRLGVAVRAASSGPVHRPALAFLVLDSEYRQRVSGNTASDPEYRVFLQLQKTLPDLL